MGITSYFSVGENFHTMGKVIYTLIIMHGLNISGL